MSVLDEPVLAERTMAVQRRLARVGERLPPSPAYLQPATDASDVVVLHLWRATQIVIDIAMGACLAFRLGTPATYAARSGVSSRQASSTPRSPTAWCAPPGSVTSWPTPTSRWT